VDHFEENAYETAKPGLGTKIKNAFKRLTNRGGKEEEEFQGTTYGPNGEKIKEKHEYKSKF